MILIKMSLVVKLRKAKKPYKYEVELNGKKIQFGASGYSDFTLSGDETKKTNYLLRHKARENWTRSGIMTKGFWSRWLLWNKPSIQGSIDDIEKRFNLKIFV